MNRIDIYKKPILLRTLVTFEEEDIDKDYATYSDIKSNIQINTDKYKEDPEFYEIVREMIFDIDKKGRPFLHIICYTWNSSYDSLEVTALMTTSVEDSKGEIDKAILYNLAMSIIYNIPVFPNSNSIEHELIEYYNQLFEYGFELLDENDELKTFNLTNFLIPNFEEEFDFQNNPLPRIYSFSEVNIYKNKLLEKLKQLDNAQYVINNLKEAINKLSLLLNDSVRNENSLQEILTNYPILFGTEYIEVLDKHSFGSEYEADYVLKRYNGLYDVVEIEASTLNIYTKQGNPSSQLVHAEQQIMDWLEWIEHNSSYAREKIKKLYSPKGYVVIGRSNTLTANNIEKLRRRNLVFRDKIEIITYDDLLDNAKLLLDFLSGNKVEND